jgi:hypothetical protein
MTETNSSSSLKLNCRISNYSELMYGSLRNGHGIQVDVRPYWGCTENIKIKM